MYGQIGEMYDIKLLVMLVFNFIENILRNGAFAHYLQNEERAQFCLVLSLSINTSPVRIL